MTNMGLSRDLDVVNERVPRELMLSRRPMPPVGRNRAGGGIVPDSNGNGANGKGLAGLPADPPPTRPMGLTLTAGTTVPHVLPQRALRIALVGEGAYPYAPGGVSLWCHQMIDGMPEHSFVAVALTVDGSEQSAWSPPRNLERVINIPLWGVTSGRHPRLRRSSPSFVQAHVAFLRLLMRRQDELLESGEDGGAFEDSLRAMVEHARDGDVSRELTSNEAVQRLGQVWRWSGIGEATPGLERLSLRDAILASSRIEHLLRPLSHPPIEADVCHLSMAGTSILIALRSKWAFGTPIVLSEHGVYLRERYLALAGEPVSHPVKLLTSRFHRALISAGYLRADALAPHSSFNSRWQMYGGGPEELMQTMYNGIDPADFPAAEGEPEEPTIVFVGRIDRLKDLHTLIRAFAIVRERLPTARLRMYGPVTTENERYFRSCVKLVEDLGLTDRASFEGRVEATVDAYRSGHLVALTSVSEGFPFTIIESMSVGRPQVATDVGGVSEAVGDAGFVVPPRDFRAVAEACLKLLTNPGLRSEMGQRARRRVLDRFTLQQWTDAYRDIYAALVPGAVPRPQRDAASDDRIIDLREAPASLDADRAPLEVSA